jgi:translation initiation factor IF-2
MTQKSGKQISNGAMSEKSEKFSRPPVVVVMGHVDHGKTTLLDYIRKANVAVKESGSPQLARFSSVVESEAGGITQSIGAYEIIHASHESRINADWTRNNAESDAEQRGYQHKSGPAAGRKITFLDTPGHEAFSKMRSRGAKAADVAILVVAADEGVKPQTKEAISHIKESKTPMVVAINKIDRPGADPGRVKQELASANVLVEGWGGDVPVAEISAKTGQGVDDLLELVLLVAEMENFTADLSVDAEGFVIESHLDRKRGPVATLLAQNGILKKGDCVLAGSAFAKIKLLENFEGKPVDEIFPSSASRVLGWEALPQVGERFQAGPEEKLQLLASDFGPAVLKAGPSKRTGDVLLIVKADVAGSLEALEESILRMPPEGIEVVVLVSDVGDVSESDIKLAHASEAIILAFRVRVSYEAELALKQCSVRIIVSDIIYELIESLEKEIARISQAKAQEAIRTRLEVLALFGFKGSRQIVGARVAEGTLTKRMLMKILRKETEIGKAKILNLQEAKRDTDKVEVGAECGLLLESPIALVKGDILIEVKDEEE